MKSKYLWALFGLMVIAGCGSNPRDDRAAGNRAPTVSAIDDQSIEANRGSEPLFFTVKDEDTDSLLVEASSDRQAIVADDNLALSGSDTERQLEVTPTADSTGAAMITIAVTDRQGLTASSEFVVTVVPEEKSIQQFARSTFADAADDEPALVNAVEFIQDADDDDFDDLFPD